MSIFNGKREITKWNYDAFKAGRDLIEKMFSTYPDEKFYWLKNIPEIPSFADFVFGAKDKVFAVALIRTRYVDGHKEIDNDVNATRYLEQVSFENNFIPLLLPINRDLTFLFQGFTFMDPGYVSKGENIKKVSPIDLIEDREVEQSDWELENLAVHTVAWCLRNEGNVTGLRVVNMPGLDPEIMFFDKEGRLSYVCVRYAKENQQEVRIDGINIVDGRMQAMGGGQARGYWTVVGIKSKRPDGKAIRGEDSLNLEYKGLNVIDIKALEQTTVVRF